MPNRGQNWEGRRLRECPARTLQCYRAPVKHTRYCWLLLTAWCLLAAVLTACITLLPPLQSTPPNFKVAFVGDQGVNSNAEAVLQLIKSEGADMVLHQGDLVYGSTPSAWDTQINSVLGEDFPYFVSLGNNEGSDWPELQALLAARLARIPGAVCEGDLGVKSACSYQNFFFVLVAPGVSDSGHNPDDNYDDFIRQQLHKDRSLWSVCSWHKNMHLMQVGGKQDETGWEVYKACRHGGGFVATGHEHSYSRTHLLSSFEHQSISSVSNTLVLEEGRTFAFVSGLGGRSIRPQNRHLLNKPWWASIYTSTQGADYGALFCTFHIDNQPEQANCYFKDISGNVPDAFNIISALR